MLSKKSKDKMSGFGKQLVKIATLHNASSILTYLVACYQRVKNMRHAKRSLLFSSIEQNLYGNILSIK